MESFHVISVNSRQSYYFLVAPSAIDNIWSSIQYIKQSLKDVVWNYGARAVSIKGIKTRNVGTKNSSSDWKSLTADSWNEQTNYLDIGEKQVWKH